MLSPMLATLADAPLTDRHLLYEPKYDGIRAIAEVPAGGTGVRLWSRLGNEKTGQFPEVAAALATWARRRKEPVVLDGEIVALDTNGNPGGFQQLQGRIHLHEVPGGRLQPAQSQQSGPSTAYILFDLLREGDTDLRDRPLVERRAALERLLGRGVNETLRLSEVAVGNGRDLYQRAIESGWEGLIAKQASSKYHSGKRTSEWRKLKIVKEQEFVIGGWTEPRNMRSHFGALLLGVYEGAGASGAPQRQPEAESPGSRPRGRNAVPARGGGAPRELKYVGHTGTGFNEKELERVMRLLKPLETKESPFSGRLKTNERPHWVKPELVAQVKFTEWTADGKLRHPVYLGLRDDKNPSDVVREKQSSRYVGPTSRSGKSGGSKEPSVAEPVLNQLEALQAGPGNGVLHLPDGGTLEVTNLRKVFWPALKITKGDLFKYYARVAPFILPAVADRPLVMKRHPNGITGKPFYQHSVEKQTIPAGVRVERIATADKRPQLVGGSLMTLLYMVQLAAMSQDPWFSRVQTLPFADYVALDLDPSDGVSFNQVLDVARWIHEELDELGGIGVPKTSGSRGLHIYLPLPPKTPYDAGLLFSQILATVVATRHPRQATIERSVRARGRRVYVDYLQNIQGKTLATAYSARASEYAGVSTPLTWKEVHDGVKREDFTMATIPARLAKVGDLWAALRQSKGNDLERVLAYAERKQGAGTRK